MQALLEPLKEYTEYRDILYNIEKDKFPLHVSGCMDSQFIHFINSLKKDSGFKNQIIVTYDEIRLNAFHAQASNHAQCVMMNNTNYYSFHISMS